MFRKPEDHAEKASNTLLTFRVPNALILTVFCIFIVGHNFLKRRGSTEASRLSAEKDAILRTAIGPLL